MNIHILIKTIQNQKYIDNLNKMMDELKKMFTNEDIDFDKELDEGVDNSNSKLQSDSENRRGWSKFRQDMMVFHPIISVIMSIIFMVFAFFTVYFTIEIFTRNDMSVLQKTIWELLILCLPVLGNLSYAFLGRTMRK